MKKLILILLTSLILAPAAALGVECDADANGYMDQSCGGLNVNVPTGLTVAELNYINTLTENVQTHMSNTSNPHSVITITGNAATATALAADGADCDAGSFPIGVDASGASEACTAVSADSAVAANTEKNTYPSADSSKLAGVEENATADMTGAQIKTAYEGEADTNEFDDAEQTKLGTVESNATADQTNSEIETAYNSQVAQVSTGEKTAGTETAVRRFAPDDVKDMIDTHGGSGGTDDQTIDVFAISGNDIQLSLEDDAEATKTVDVSTATAVAANTTKRSYPSGDETKLGLIEDNATADMTGAQIKAAYEGEANTNEFDDTEQTKLGNIENNATADMTGAQIKTAYEGEADTNEFDDTEQSKLAAIESSATADQTNSEIETAYNAQVAQVSAGEKTAGTETTIRRFAPDDVKDMIDTHSAGGSALEVEDESVSLDTAVTKLNFLGSGVTAAENADHEIDVTIAGGGAPVDTVFGRTGTVVAVTDDYTADQIDDAATTNKFATTAELSAIATNTSHGASTSDPHSVTKTQVGLANVENTAHSTDAHTMAIDGRDVSVDGAKLDGIAPGADQTSSNETSHASVVDDGDFGADGILVRSGGTGSYSVITDDSSEWDTAYTHSQASHAPTNADNTAANETSHALVLETTDVDDVPVNGATTDPVSSNRMYDHENASNISSGTLDEAMIDADIARDSEVESKYVSGTEADFYGTIVAPDAMYQNSPNITLITRMPAAMHITEIEVTCDASTALQFEFKRKAVGIGFGSPTTIDTLLTDAGTDRETGLDLAIAQNQKVFVTIGDPADTLLECAWTIIGDWD